MKEILFLILNFFDNKKTELNNEVLEHESIITKYENETEEFNIVSSYNKDWVFFSLKNSNNEIIFQTKNINEIQTFIEAESSKKRKEVIERKKLVTLKTKDIGKINFILDNPKKIKVNIDMSIWFWDKGNIIKATLELNDKTYSTFFNRFGKELSVIVENKLNGIKENILFDGIIDDNEKKEINSLNNLNIDEIIDGYKSIDNNLTDNKVNSIWLNNSEKSELLWELIINDNVNINQLDTLSIDNDLSKNILENVEDNNNKIINWLWDNNIDTEVEINNNATIEDLINTQDNLILENDLWNDLENSLWNDILLNNNIEEELEIYDNATIEDLMTNHDNLISEDNLILENDLNNYLLDDDLLNNSNLIDDTLLDNNDLTLNNDWLENELLNWDINNLVLNKDTEIVEDISINDNYNDMLNNNATIEDLMTNHDNLISEDNLWNNSDNFLLEDNNIKEELEIYNNEIIDDLLDTQNNDILLDNDLLDNDDNLSIENISSNELLDNKSTIDNELSINLDDNLNIDSLNNNEIINIEAISIDDSNFNDFENSLVIEDNIDNTNNDLNKHNRKWINELDLNNELDKDLTISDLISSDDDNDNDLSNLENDVKLEEQILDINLLLNDDNNKSIKLEEQNIESEIKLDDNLIYNDNITDIRNKEVDNNFDLDSLLSDDALWLWDNKNIQNNIVDENIIKESEIIDNNIKSEQEIKIEEDKRKKYDEDKIWKEKLFKFLENSKSVNLTTFKQTKFAVKKESFLDNYTKKEKILWWTVISMWVVILLTIVWMYSIISDVNTKMNTSETTFKQQIATLQKENDKLKEDQKSVTDKYNQLEQDSKPITWSSQISLLNIKSITINKKNDPDMKYKVYAWTNNSYLSLYPKIIWPEIGDLVYINLKNWSEVVYKVKKSYNGNNLPDIVSTAENDKITKETWFIIISWLNSDWYYVAVPL